MKRRRKTELAALRKEQQLKVTLLSAPVSSELPFCETDLLRKQLISPMLFGLWKRGKKDVIPHSLGCINRNISVTAGFSSYSSKLFVDFRKKKFF